MGTWLIHRRFPVVDNKGSKIDLEESLCAEIFNTMGYLFEILKSKKFVCPVGWSIEFEDTDNNCGWYVMTDMNECLWKDLTLRIGTGWDNHKYGEAPGYWPTKEEAEDALRQYLEKKE